MSIARKIVNEIKMLGAATIYFWIWIGALLVLKKLILVEYRIEAVGLSKALIGALVLAKVVLVLEHVSLGAWVRNRPAWVEVVLRTALYTLGVFVVVVIEKSLHGQHEHGGFASAMAAALKQAHLNHVLANTICVGSALFSYNVLSIVREHLGQRGLMRLFLSPRAGIR